MDKVENIFKPIGNKLIALKPDETKTKSGIILQNTDNIDTIKVKILSVGDNVKNVKEGDEILISKRLVGAFEWENKKFYLIDENNIIAVIQN